MKSMITRLEINLVPIYLGYLFLLFFDIYEIIIFV